MLTMVEGSPEFQLTWFRLRASSFDLGDVAKAHQGVLVAAHDEALELRDAGHVRGRGQVDLQQIVLGLTDAGLNVLPPQRRAHVEGGDVERRHAPGVEPDAHGELLITHDVRPWRRRESPACAGWHAAHQVVGDLRCAHGVAGEADVHQRPALLGAHVDHRIQRFAGNLIALAADLGLNLCHGGVAVVVELHHCFDDRDP
jgi:hypothetical protein